jgi:hypothetical protein
MADNSGLIELSSLYKNDNYDYVYDLRQQAERELSKALGEKEYHVSGALKTAALEGLAGLGAIPKTLGMSEIGQNVTDYYNDIAEKSPDVNEFRTAQAEGRESIWTEALGTSGPTAVAAGMALIPYAGLPMATAYFFHLNKDEIEQMSLSKGADPTTAKVTGYIGGAVNSLLDMIPLSSYVNKNPLTKGLVDSFKHRLVGAGLKLMAEGGMEGATEGTQQLISSISSEYAASKDTGDFLKKVNQPEWWDNTLKDVGKSVAIGSIMGLGFGGASAGAGAMLNRNVQPPQLNAQEKANLINLAQQEFNNGNITPDELSRIKTIHPDLSEDIDDIINTRIIDEINQTGDVNVINKYSPAQESAQVFIDQMATDQSLRQSPQGAELLKVQRSSQEAGENTMYEIMEGPQKGSSLLRGALTQTPEKYAVDESLMPSVAQKAEVNINDAMAKELEKAQAKKAAQPIKEEWESFADDALKERDTDIKSLRKKANKARTDGREEIAQIYEGQIRDYESIDAAAFKDDVKNNLTYYSKSNIDPFLRFKNKETNRGISKPEPPKPPLPTEPTTEQGTEKPVLAEEPAKEGKPKEAEPPIPKGMTRLYHGSATKGRTDGKAWFSTNKEYAKNYREGAELQYVDYPTEKVNAALDPDNYGQTVDRGFTWNVELDSAETGERKILQPAPAEKGEGKRKQYDVGFHIRDTLVSSEALNTLPEENVKRILEIKDEFSKLGYIDFRTEMGPDQIRRMSENQKKKLNQKFQDAVALESEVKELLKTEDQLTKEKDQKAKDDIKAELDAAKNRKNQIENYLQKQLQSPRENTTKKEYREINDKIKELETQSQPKQAEEKPAAQDTTPTSKTKPGKVFLEKGGVKPFFEYKEITRGKVLNKGKYRVTLTNGKTVIVNKEAIREFPSAQEDTGDKPVFLKEAKNDIDDAKYLELAKDPEKNREELQRMVNDAAEKAGYTSSDEYRMQHQAPDSTSGIRLDKVMDDDTVPKDYWDRPDYYQYYNDEYSSFYKIKKAVELQKQYDKEGTGKKSRIFVYRAIPKNIKDDNFRNGDWVSPSREYAQREGKQILEGYRIIVKKVDISDLYWDANSINEMGYDDGKNYAYKNTKNNRKLLDPVLYSPSGVYVIPLSKRFNFREYSTSFLKDLTPTGKTLLSKQGVENIIKGIKTKLPNIGNFEVVKTQDELPEFLFKEQKRDDSRIYGVYDPQSDTFYLVADNMKNRDTVLNTVIHEAIGHRGVDAILPKSRRKQLFRMVNFEYGKKDLGQKIIKDYKLDLTDEIDQVTFAREVIAHMAVNEPKASLLDRVISMIKSALRELGITLKISDAEIRGLLARSYKFAQTGKGKVDKNAGVAYEIQAWHGGPHKFDKFTTEKIGTGEGAQAFGWGLYFTDLEDIGRHYAETQPQVNPVKRRTFKGEEVDPRSPEYHAASLMKDGTPLARIRYEVEGWIRDAKEGENIDHYAKVLAVLNSATSKKDFGELPPAKNLYKVTLHKGKQPGEYTWLDWDNKLASSPKDARQNSHIFKKIYNQAVKENIKDANETHWRSSLGTMMSNHNGGASTYNWLKQILGSDKEASLFLLRAGIDGIRYPAGSLSGGVSTGYTFKGEKLPGTLDVIAKWATDTTMPDNIFRKHFDRELSEWHGNPLWKDKLKDANRADFVKEKEPSNYVVFDENAVTIEEQISFSKEKIDKTDKRIMFSLSSEEKKKAEIIKESQGILQGLKDKMDKVNNALESGKWKHKKKDLRPITDALLSTPLHSYDRIPTLGRMFDTANEKIDINNEVLDSLTRNPETDEVYTRLIESVKKSDPEAYKKWVDYRVHQDKNQIGYKVRLNPETGKWDLYSPAELLDSEYDTEIEALNAKQKAPGITWYVKVGDKYNLYKTQDKPVASYDSEADAWKYARLFEAKSFMKLHNASEEVMKAFLAEKTMLDNGFNIQMQAMRDIIKYYKDNDMPLPSTPITIEGETVQVDLEMAMALMGDRRGYYFPRIRNNGQFKLTATKGNKGYIDFYDLGAEITEEKSRGNLLRHVLNSVSPMGKKARELKGQGYEVTIEKADRTPEEVFVEQTRRIINQQTLINDALKAVKKGKVSFDTLGFEVEKSKGTNKRGNPVEFITLDGNTNKKQRELFKTFGGEYYATTKGEKEVWHFRNTGKTFESRLLKALGTVSNNVELETVHLFAQELVDSLANMEKGRGARSHMIQRDTSRGDDVWDGYETDVLTAVSKYVAGIAGSESKKIMSGKLMRQFFGIDITWDEFKEAKAFEGSYSEFVDSRPDNKVMMTESDFNEINDPEGYAENQKLIEELKDSDGSEKQDAYDWMYSQYQDLVEDRKIDDQEQTVAWKDGKSFIENMIRNEESLDRIMGFFKGLAVLKYLAGRVSAPVINLTALATSAPGAMNAFGDISIIKSLNLIQQYARKYGSYMLTKEGKNKLSEDERWVFDTIRSKGWDSAAFNREALGALETKSGKAWRRIIELSMWGFGVTERLNRASTIAATYFGLTETRPDMSKEERLKLAKDISDKAHGVYNKSNMPAWARGSGIAGNMARSFYVFKTFSHNYLQTMSKAWGPGWTPEHAKAFSFMALAPAVLAGGGAVVGKEVLIMFAKALGLGGDDPEEEFYKFVADTFGETSEDVARYGLAGLAGVNLKGSLEIGITDLPTNIQDIMGAPGSIVKDIYEGGVNISKGNIIKGLENIMPLAISNPIKGIREATEGLTTKTNAPIFYGKKPVVADTVDALLRMASFNPAELSEIREKQWAERKIEQKYTERRADTYAKAKKYMLKPYEDRNEADWIDIIAEIQKYNDLISERGYNNIPKITNKSLKNNLRRAFKPSKKERLRETED